MSALSTRRMNSFFNPDNIQAFGAHFNFDIRPMERLDDVTDDVCHW